MASIRKHGEKWRAEVFRNGKRSSKVLRTKREAQDWAARQEFLIEQGGSDRPVMTLSEATQRYEREIMPAKTARWNSTGSELYCIRMILADELAAKPVADITPTDLSAWRDRRLMTVSPASAQRYMNTLSSILSACEKDWELIDANPMRKVRRPPATEPRKRRPTAEEIERLAVAGNDVRTSLGRAHIAFMFAIETGMRVSEITSLTPETVNVEKRVAHLARTKNGTSRDVPLSREAIRLLGLLPPDTPLFGFQKGTTLSTN